MSKNKTIWIINEYAGSPYHGQGTRHYYLGKELIKKGYNVWIITANYSHFLYRFPSTSGNFSRQNIDGVNYLWIKVNKYRNSQDIRRIFKWFIFSFKLLLLNKHIKILKVEKPEFVVASCPDVFHFLPSYILSKKFGAKFIFEVRDIWPASLVEIGNFSDKNLLIKLMKKFEKFAIEKSDAIISLLPNYDKYLISQGYNKHFYYLPNGYYIDESQIESLPKDIEVQIPKNKFIVAYTGAIGKANALEYLIEAAYRLKDYKDIIFLIVGEGAEKENLKKRVKNLKLGNVIFLPLVKKTQVQSILRLVDVCYIGWRKKEIYSYGISANKIFDYMYSGKPVLHSYSGEADPIKEANCGITVEAENPEAIAGSLLRLYNMQQIERAKLGENGKKYLMEHHTNQQLAQKLVEILDAIA